MNLAFESNTGDTLPDNCSAGPAGSHKTLQTLPKHDSHLSQAALNLHYPSVANLINEMWEAAIDVEEHAERSDFKRKDVEVAFPDLTVRTSAACIGFSIFLHVCCAGQLNTCMLLANSLLQTSQLALILL